ncbi:hypothetical protein AVEN_161648-1 [Araneus ventricosus]|uniref:Uncharacterized protein n=1 Tax=Araneus ventricosus TaxID=182803 RepID=A0A4Y2W1W6_ARAVE|nr:hypothetical protein AVEN_36043-1 [Araneus ventricosus]GBO30012.1 hypothetical protein AVEN_161648-1 [Araneus ventricosus]
MTRMTPEPTLHLTNFHATVKERRFTASDRSVQYSDNATIFGKIGYKTRDLEAESQARGPKQMGKGGSGLTYLENSSPRATRKVFINTTCMI